MEHTAENKVVTYPAPAGAALQRDYIVRVRPLGEDEWQQLDCYQVKVDMHDVRLASMAYFDFKRTSGLFPCRLSRWWNPGGSASY